MSTPYQDAVLADGPLALWPLTERAGSTTAVDVTGNGFDSSYPGDGSVTLAVDGPGAGGCCSCVQFNDTSTSSGSGHGPGLSIANAPNLPLNPAQLTIEAWLQPIAPGDTTTSFSGCVLSWGNDPTQSNPNLTWLVDALIWPSGAPCALTYPKLQDGDLTSSGILRPDQGLSDCPLGGWPLGSWHHLAVCLDRTTPANNGIYLDGEPWAAGLFYYPFTPRSDPITFGTIGSVLYETWCGGMAYVALYTKCLTQAQLRAHVAASLCPASWLRLRHASGRSYVQQNGEQVQVVAGGVGLLDLPLPALPTSPPTLVGKDPATGMPAFCPAPIPTTTTVVLGGGGGSQPAPPPQCVQMRCGVSGACRDHLVSLYQDWSHWLDPLFQAAATLGVAVAVATLPWDWLLDLEAGLVIKSGIVSMLQGFGSAITGNLLPLLDVDLQTDIQRALFDHLTCTNDQVQVSADNVAAWKAALDALTTWPVASVAGPFCGLLLQYTPLARWQAAASTASPSTLCDAWP